MRRRFVVKDGGEFAMLRAKVGMQKTLVSPGLSPATISRMERGFAVAEEGARAMHRIIAPQRAFEDLFGLSISKPDAIKFSWEQVNRSAARIGRKIFSEFQPHFIITFAGPSALFASLVMARSLTRERFLATQIYTGIFHRKSATSVSETMAGFDTISTHRFLVRVPMAVRHVKGRATKRVAIIDDTVTTGSVLEHLKRYLAENGYKVRNIQYATCVCSHVAFANELTRPDILTYRVRGRYRMPWGDPL